MRPLYLFLNFCFLWFTLCCSEHKIISLTPSITETLYLLDESTNVVGITSFCKKISDTQKIVGTYLEPNIETIVKISPTVVFISKEGVRKEIVERLKKFNINVVVFEPVNSYEEIKEQFLNISKYLNKEKIAKKVIKEYETKFKLNSVNRKKLKILCVISLQPLIVASDKSYIGDIIKYSGGINPVKSSLRYPQISVEEILKINPDVIILPDMGMKEKEVKNFFNRFNNLVAVKNNNIYILPSDILCQPNIKNFFISVEMIHRLLKK